MKKLTALLLTAALFLTACGKQEKTYTDPLEYLADHVAKANLLQNDTFAVFADIKPLNDRALTKYDLPQTLGDFSRVEKVGDHWYVIDSVRKANGYRDGVALYVLRDGKLVKLFDKSQALEVYEYEFGVDILLRGEIDGKIHFDVTRQANSQAPKTDPLYVVDLKSGALEVVPHEQDVWTYPPISEYDPTLIDGVFGELYLTAKQYNDLYEQNNKIDKQTVFPPEDEAAENKQVARVVTLKDGSFDRPLMLPVADNANYAEMRQTDIPLLYVTDVAGYTNDNREFYSDMLVYDAKDNVFYDIASKMGDDNIKLWSFTDGKTLAVIAETQLVMVDLTKI